MITGIFIDSREPEWIQKLSFGGIPTMVTLMDHGDLMAATDDGQMLLFERKTVDDLLNSLRENRLFNQLASMQMQSRWSYLVITGDLQRGPDNHVITDRGNTGWSWASVQGALLTAQELGIFVINAGADTQYEETILKLGSRSHDPTTYLSPVKFPHILTAREQIIASLPGIGLDRLQQVMEACITPAWALVCLTDPTTKIPGIGPGVKTKIRAALGLKDADQMALILSDSDDEVLVTAPLGAQ